MQPQPTTILRGGLAVLAAAVLNIALVSGAPAEQPDRPGKLEIIRLLQAREFPRLEDILMGPGEPAGRERPHRALDFSDFAHSDPANEAALTAWIESRPISVAARLARATYFQHLGFLARGGKVARQTAQTQFRAMQEFLNLAAQDYQQALQRDERLDVAYAGLIGIANATGRREAARRLRRAGLDAIPDSPVIHFQYTGSLVPKWGGSLSELQAYIVGLRNRYSDDPRFAALEGYADRVVADEYRIRGRHEDALEHISAAIAAYHNSTRYGERAILYRHLDRDEEALADIDRAIRLSPDSGYLHEYKSWIQRERGALADAMASADRAVALDPLNPSRLLTRARLHSKQALIARQRKKMQRHRDSARRAEQDYEAALIYGDGDPNIWQSMGWLYAQITHNWERARVVLETTIELAPNRGKPRRWYLDVLFAQKDCEAIEAARNYLAVCEKDSDCRLDTAMPNYVMSHMDWCNRPTSDAEPRRREIPGFYGRMHACGELFLDKNKAAAVEQCRRRADAGEAGAQYDMGLLSQVGKHVAKDGRAAASWMKKSADGGDIDALATLGVYYLRGPGVERDAERGLGMIREAADKGSFVGMVSLAYAYYDGSGVKQDKKTSRKLLRKAAALGSPIAAHLMKRWFGFGDG